MIMRSTTLALAAAISVAASVAAFAQSAQEAYVVTYIEVAPKEAAAARKMLATYRDAAAKAAGMLQFDALQRIGTPSHFAIVETWSSAKAQADFAASDKAKEYRKALAPLLSAAYDERPHTALSVGGKAAASGSVYAVTHVDIIPPKKDEGVAATKALADKSRTAVDALRFDALTQTSRPNHMTVVESWKSKTAKDNFTTAAHLKSYREALTPMSGSLYDERLYTRIK